MALMKSDFEKYGVNEVLARIAAEVDPMIYFAPGFFTDLSSESKRYRDDGDEIGASLFRLLAKISSMGFWGEQTHAKQPFGPMCKGLEEDQRSFLPVDLEGAELDFLADVVSDIEEAVMCAQIADTLWLRKYGESHGYSFAILAYDSYLASVSFENPGFYMGERLTRAFKICKLLNDDARRENALELAKKFAETLLETDQFTLWSNVIELLATYSEDWDERNEFAEQIWQRLPSLSRRRDWTLPFAVWRMSFPFSANSETGIVPKRHKGSWQINWPVTQNRWLMRVILGGPV